MATHQSDSLSRTEIPSSEAARIVAPDHDRVERYTTGKFG